MAVTQQTTIFTYAADGVQTVFGFACRVLAAADLTVQLNGVTATLGADYAVAGLGIDAGGTVTFMSAPAAGVQVRLFRTTRPVRTTDYQTAGDFKASTVNADLDRILMAIQDLANGAAAIANVLRVPPGEAVDELPPAATRASKLLGFDADGMPVSLVGALADSATALDMILQANAGAGEVGYLGSVAYSSNTVGAALNARPATVATIAALRATLKFSGARVSVTGYYATGDGGGGLYRYDASDTTTADNGGTTIVGTDGGRWKLDVAIAQISPKTFGAKADGTTNDIAAIQAAHDYFAGLSAGGTLVFPAGGSYKCNTTFTWNPNKVAIEGRGAVLDFTSISAGVYAITLTQTTADVNARFGQNQAHPCEKLYILGPGGTVASTAVKLVDPTGANVMAGVCFNNCSFVNFYRDLELGNGSFLNAFYGCDFFITAGSGYDTIVYIPTAMNSGENTRFVSCNFNKSIGSAIRQVNTNAVTVFRACSADYMAKVFEVTGGEVDWDGYIESSQDVAYWGSVAGQNSLLRVAGRITITANKSAFEIFYSDSTCTNGGLVLDASIQFSTVTYPLELVAGTGRVRSTMRAASNTAPHPAIGAGSNVLANGGFESAALTDWTLTGTTPPTRSTTVAHAGTYSLRFQGISGQNNGASRSVPCSPGQELRGSLWWQAPALTGSGATFYIALDYLDAGGVSLAGSVIVAATANQATWVKAAVSSLAPAPIGTASARLSISIFSTTGGTPIGYIDDATLAVT